MALQYKIYDKAQNNFVEVDDFIMMSSDDNCQINVFVIDLTTGQI